jgi:hypothetical protein
LACTGSGRIIVLIHPALDLGRSFGSAVSFPLEKREGDSGFQIYISIGQAF